MLFLASYTFGSRLGIKVRETIIFFDWVNRNCFYRDLYVQAYYAFSFANKVSSPPIAFTWVDVGTALT